MIEQLNGQSRGLIYRLGLLEQAPAQSQQKLVEGAALGGVFDEDGQRVLKGGAGFFFGVAVGRDFKGGTVSHVLAAVVVENEQYLYLGFGEAAVRVGGEDSHSENRDKNRGGARFR